MSTGSALDLLDWRRRVFALYAEVRAAADPRAAHELWARTRAELVATHPASPRLGVTLQVAPYNERWRFASILEPAEKVRIEVPTGTDGIVPFERVGRLRLTSPESADARPEAGFLDVWALRSYGGGLFVPFRDQSAGRTTYGGGRYLLDTVKGADLGQVGPRLVVDLNFAYNPSCAYDEAWACPLAPPGNVLDIEVPVGETLPTSPAAGP